MSFADAMKREEALALARNARIRAEWEDFYESCTVDDVCHYLGEYLADFDLAGARVRRNYDLDVSLCLAEALMRAKSRQQGPIADLEPTSEALERYNAAVRSRGSDASVNAHLAGLRLTLAAALLAID